MGHTTTATNIYLGTCKPCVRPVRIESDNGGKAMTVPCTECGSPVTVERLVAVTSTTTRCDSLCRTATGIECVCSCGGMNHGMTWLRRPGTTLMTEKELAAYRAKVQKRREAAERRRQAKQAKARAEFDAWVADHTDVVEYLEGVDPVTGHMFLVEMRGLVRRGKPLTERQAEAVRRFIANEERRRREPAEREASKRPVPTGTVTLEGVVAWVGMREGHWGTEYRMRVEGDGWQVWTSVTANLRQAVNYALRELRGRRVRFVASVEAAKNDPCTGFARRPRKAELLG